MTSAVTPAPYAETRCTVTGWSAPARTRVPERGTGVPSATTRSTARSSTPSDPGGVSRRSAASRTATTACLVRRPQVRPRWRGRHAPVVVGPPVGQDDVLQRCPLRPAGPLQTRRGRPLVGPAETQPAQGDHTVGQVQQRGEVLRLEQRHPPDAEALGTGGEPQVLDRAGARPQVGVGERGAAEHACGGGASVAAHHHPQRRVPDAVQLEVEQSPGRVRCQARRLGQPLAVGHQRRPLPGRRVPDDDEAPGLGVPDRRAGVGCREHPLQRGVGGTGSARNRRMSRRAPMTSYNA